MKLYIEITSTEKGYELKSDLDFDKSRPKEFCLVGYSYTVLGVILKDYLVRMKDQASSKPSTLIDFTIGVSKAVEEAKINETWPFSIKITRDEI